MSHETIARAFEPFFTTKDIGHGTGLGLSQVYGFVKQSGGNVKIYSEVGQGTTVKIYLPRVHSDAGPSYDNDASLPVPRSSSGQTILVVEDEEEVRAYSTSILRELGYEVLEAGSGSAGLQVLHAHPEVVLLFTDVGLPGGMTGRQLADAAVQINPKLKVLFTTGYARNAIVHDGRLDPGVMLLPKPFTYNALASKLSDMLEMREGEVTVLLVEDEPLIQLLGADYLQEDGYVVETAGSATEAMNKIKMLNGQIDLAIIDVGLPDRKGDLLVAELRAIYPHLPIIVATGYDEMAMCKKFGSDNRVGYLRKPYSREEVLLAVKQALPI
jgi:CheY-like chemotaxis protein